LPRGQLEIEITLTIIRDPKFNIILNTKDTINRIGTENCQFGIKLLLVIANKRKNIIDDIVKVDTINGIIS